MTTAINDLIKRLRLEPEDIGGPSRMTMLRERTEAAQLIQDLQEALTMTRQGLAAAAVALKGGSNFEALSICRHHEAQVAKVITAPKKRT